MKRHSAKGLHPRVLRADKMLAGMDAGRPRQSLERLAALVAAAGSSRHRTIWRAYRGAVNDAGHAARSPTAAGHRGRVDICAPPEPIGPPFRCHRATWRRPCPPTTKAIPESGTDQGRGGARHDRPRRRHRFLRQGGACEPRGRQPRRAYLSRDRAGRHLRRKHRGCHHVGGGARQQTLRNLRWFEVVRTSGHIVDGASSTIR